MNERVRWTQLLKSWAKKRENWRTVEKDKFKDFKQKKNIQQNREKGDSVCIFGYVCDSARK